MRDKGKITGQYKNMSVGKTSGRPLPHTSRWNPPQDFQKIVLVWLASHGPDLPKIPKDCFGQLVEDHHLLPRRLGRANSILDKPLEFPIRVKHILHCIIFLTSVLSFSVTVIHCFRILCLKSVRMTRNVAGKLRSTRPTAITMIECHLGQLPLSLENSITALKLIRCSVPSDTYVKFLAYR